MSTNEVRQRFIDFFVKKYNHAEIPSASLIPDNDPTVLFTTAGMHPLVPYLMGEIHPKGKKLTNSQKCIRTVDFDEVGDKTHFTFFEMLGNWSLGDYFKKEAIEMSWELLTTPLEKGGFGLEKSRFHVTCFEGDEDAPKDEEAIQIWQKLGFKLYSKQNKKEKNLIFLYEKKKCWWGPAGQTGPCGPNTEIFYDNFPELSSDQHNPTATQEKILNYTKSGIEGCHANCDCGRYTEIWNDVFMTYEKTTEGKFVELKQKNVDTGMGLERIVAILQNVDSPYETDMFLQAKQKIQELANDINSSEEKIISTRIIADHLRAATFILGDKLGVTPSNTDQGYILRRMIRRAIRHARKLGIFQKFTSDIAQTFINFYSSSYPELEENKHRILTELEQEEAKFTKTISQGEKEFNKIAAELLAKKQTTLPGEKVFMLYDTHGFPVEITEELAKEKGLSINKSDFETRFKKHQELSRAGAAQKFAGGLADHSYESRKLHTATHLLHKALKIILGENVEQKGSNITKERLRFDFNYPKKLTSEQIKQLEDIVNEQIKRKLPINFEIVSLDEAKKMGAIGLFEEKYGDKVKVYKMGDFSLEFCGGPHAENTGDLKEFKIIKEEACSAGIRRIKAIVKNS